MVVVPGRLTRLVRFASLTVYTEGLSVIFMPSSDGICALDVVLVVVSISPILLEVVVVYDALVAVLLLLAVLLLVATYSS